MKKKIKWVFLSIFAVIVIAVAALAVYLFAPEKKPEAVRPTITDVSGNAYLVTYGDNGETYVAVTDESNKVWAAEYDDKGNVGSTVFSLDGNYSTDDIPKNYSGPVIDETEANNAYSGEVSEIEPTSAQAEQATHLVKKYSEMFKTGTYYMEFTTNDETMGDEPISAAAKNGNLIFKANMEGINCRMLYIAETDSIYILLDDAKKYGKIPKDFLGEDMDMSEFTMEKSFASAIPDEEIKTSKVKIDGKTLTCESCKSDDGDLMKYYFNGDALVRFDRTSAEDGSTISTYISKLSSVVPASTFEIPSNYGYINLSVLESMV